jgi:hypothetical protein
MSLANSSTEGASREYFQGSTVGSQCLCSNLIILLRERRSEVGSLITSHFAASAARELPITHLLGQTCKLYMCSDPVLLGSMAVTPMRSAAESMVRLTLTQPGVPFGESSG